MTKTYKILLVFLVASTKVWAQSAEGDFPLSSIKAPSSPAFTILGIQPTEISSPKSYEALEAGLLNNFLSNDASPVIPSDYSLEFTPYWFSKNISYQDYVEPTPTQTLLQNLSFSIATLNDASDSSLVNIGLGLRTVMDFGSTQKQYQNIIKGNIEKLDKGQSTILNFNDTIDRVLENADNYKAYSKLKKAVQEQAKADEKELGKNINKDLFFILINGYLDRAGALFKEGAPTQEDLSALEDSILSESDKYVKEYAATISQAVKERNGFKIEIATALKLESQKGQFAGLTAPKFGVWITPSYQIPENPQWEFLGVFRYIRNDNDMVEDMSLLDEDIQLTNNWDIGARLKYKKKAFTFSGEFIFRQQKASLDATQEGGITISQTASRNDHKFDFAFSYNISDKVAISYTFGENFDLNTELEKNLMSLVSLNFGFGGPQKSDLIH